MSEKYKVVDSTVPTFITITVVDWVDLLIRPIYCNIIDDSLNYCIKEKGLSVYVTKELKASDNILSDIEGKSLDTQQRKAVVIDEDNNLIIVGAGSGKTTTIAGKVKYLTERLNVDKSKILLISFTRKSAEEMSDRIRNKMKIDLPVKTFHKLGLDIIAESTNEKPSIFSLSPKEITELIVFKKKHYLIHLHKNRS